jgi:hypothetical protein
MQATKFDLVINLKTAKSPWAEPALNRCSAAPTK